MKFCEEKCEVSDASVPEILLENSWFMSCCGFLEPEISWLYSLRFEARFIVYPSFGHAMISKD
jgi:hypothetical protein